MFRNTSTLNLHLLRHAEAYKNLEGIHGGGDQKLTPVGKAQARALGRLLLQANRGADGLYIIHQPEERSAATARHIRQVTLGVISEESRLKGVGMGIVAGLSEHELRERYPDVANSIKDWRDNGGILKRPDVPGSEAMVDFANRVRAGLLDSIEDATGNLAIVGTTSTLVMLRHLLQNDGVFDRPSYEFIDMPLGSAASWIISSKRPAEIMPATTKGLQ